MLGRRPEKNEKLLRGTTSTNIKSSLIFFTDGIFFSIIFNPAQKKREEIGF
jgi:hypothetical protein